MRSLLPLLCWLLIALAGCCVSNNPSQSDALGLKRFFSSAAASAECETATVLYGGTFEKPGRFLIGYYAGTNSSEVTNLLVKACIRQVRLEPRWITERQAVEQLRADLGRAGIRVVQGAATPQAQLAVSKPREPQLACQTGATILLGTWLKRDEFFLSLHEERKLKAVVRKLSNAGMSGVIIESEIKFPPEDVDEVYDLVELAGLRVKQFWVPTGTIHPGLIDLEATRPRRP